LNNTNNLAFVAIGGLVFIALAIRRKVRGFKPSRRRLIFKVDKNRQNDFFRKGSEAVGPMS
jgi:hypothetical protein